jgi:hypothetical protein
MNISAQIAKHFREIHLGGNWTSVNLKDTIADVTWQQATTKVHSFNTIATLVFHVNYYVSTVLKVLQGGPLDAHDKYSFAHPPIDSPEDWQNMTQKAFTEAEALVNLIEQLPEPQLWENFTEEKYGNYYRNFHGIIEHTHYHLGQIVLIKKILMADEKE